MLFHDLSQKATEEAIQGAIQILRSNYITCSSSLAWNTDNLSTYKNCTDIIGASDSQIFNAMDKIEKVATANNFSSIDIWLSLEDMANDFDVYDSVKLGFAIENIEKMAENISSPAYCDQDCLGKMRSIIIQLKLISWGFYGPADSTAGLYLAYHRDKIGKYYQNSNGNQWPYHPLHEQPTDIEIRLNNFLTKITEALTDGRLRNVSLLDFPAFGSPISNLELFQTKESNWPNEVNFAIYNQHEENISAVFSQYKSQMDLWAQYMDLLNEDATNYQLKFPPNISQTSFDYTNAIFHNLPAFLEVAAGSFPTASKRSSSIWKEIATSVFGDTLDRDFVEKNGLYDKLVMTCAFRKSLSKNTWKEDDLLGGCEHFDIALTSSGLCYSFNGYSPSTTWRASTIVQEFEEKYERHNPNLKFGGTGANEGNFKNYNFSLWLYMNTKY